MHVGIALDAGGKLDLLRRAGGARVEPAPRVRTIALDGDEPSAGVGRLDLHLDVVTCRVVRARESDLQLRILLERAREVRVAGDVIFDARQALPVRTADDVGIRTRRIGRQRQRHAGLRHDELPLIEHHVLAA